ncbi:DSD1 family PLP-dependent enzyme [Lunatimonas salinarum]|uniref:DSD1 family PLP-dependent enzyme n=1 Tax=Lunatimonas salinarum TaxID=1774590 RepID=UPI001ADF1AE2|nr:DSD1 family PLP-dependent enzyme [Lunatimonas salinarum]
MRSSFNRRRFLQTAALSGAGLWVTPQLRAASSSEGLHTAIGKSKWELDTPALCLDLDKLEHNLKAASIPLRGSGVGLRPHVKTHKCPDLAKMQLAHGAVGVCAAKLSESEVMLENGIDSVLMTGVNVTAPKIRRAMEIRKKHAGFIQAVDNPQNARDLQEAAQAAGIVADVVVDIDVIRRSGVPAGQPALQLAQLVDKSPNLRFRGILAYDGGVQHVKGFEARKTRCLNTFEPVVATYQMMYQAGLNMEIFSGGGTGTYDMMHEIPGFTDVQVGSYLFMDCQYLEIGGAKNPERFDDFEAALTVLTTVINTNHAGRLITDGGAKAFTLNKPSGWVIGEPDFVYNAGSDEYGTITYEESNRGYRVGDPLEVIVPHCDPAVNLYDVIYGIRNDKVEQVLPVLARGMSV